MNGIAVVVGVAVVVGIGVVLWRLLGRPKDPEGTRINRQGPPFVGYGLEGGPLEDAQRAMREGESESDGPATAKPPAERK